MQFINMRSVIIGCALGAMGVTAVSAGTINFMGQLDLVFEDSGGGAYSGVPLGTTFSGMIDDVTAGGSISDGTTTTDFGCCIAAGGLDGFAESNDQTIDAGAATVINGIQSVRTFAAGDLVDIVNLEGDTFLSNGNRIEVGLSFVFDATTFTSASNEIYPFGSNDPLFTLFFILEEDTASDEDIYSVIGLVDDLQFPSSVDPEPPVSPVPLPAGLPLMIGGLLTLGLVSRRRGTAA